MTSTKKDPVLVVLQLSGGNDGINTVIPYGDPHYADHRPAVRVPGRPGIEAQRPRGPEPQHGPNEAAL